MLKRLRSLFRSSRQKQFAPVGIRVDDSPGWSSTTGRGHDRDYSEIQELYTDALTAWRKNPIAWRIISITTDYVIGKTYQLTSPFIPLNDFISEFWSHSKNRMDLRLTALCDELSRAGDLFIVLFRNPIDGMSYIRYLTKDNIISIDTAENDWETEVSYEEAVPGTVNTKTWFSPSAEGSLDSDAIVLHYSINRPLGALMGESDITTVVPWLLRYSRMLEDRVRLHWAARAFLYLVTVPPNKVESKSAQYAAAPDSGSIIVKDESESWETITPSLRGADASHDMKSVRNMIDAGSGYPPHWRGEGGDVNVATAEAMQAPPEKHLARRQQYFTYILQDILYHAYLRAQPYRNLPDLPSTSYDKLFKVNAPDVSARDNVQLATAASTVTTALQGLEQILQGNTTADFKSLVTDIILNFAGEPVNEKALKKLIRQPSSSKPISAPPEPEE